MSTSTRTPSHQQILQLTRQKLLSPNLPLRKQILIQSVISLTRTLPRVTRGGLKMGPPPGLERVPLYKRYPLASTNPTPINNPTPIKRLEDVKTLEDTVKINPDTRQSPPTKVQTHTTPSPIPILNLSPINHPTSPKLPSTSPLGSVPISQTPKAGTPRRRSKGWPGLMEVHGLGGFGTLGNFASNPSGPSESSYNPYNVHVLPFSTGAPGTPPSSPQMRCQPASAHAQYGMMLCGTA